MLRILFTMGDSGSRMLQLPLKWQHLAAKCCKMSQRAQKCCKTLEMANSNQNGQNRKSKKNKPFQTALPLNYDSRVTLRLQHSNGDFDAPLRHRLRSWTRNGFWVDFVPLLQDALRISRQNEAVEHARPRMKSSYVLHRTEDRSPFLSFLGMDMGRHCAYWRSLRM